MTWGRDPHTQSHPTNEGGDPTENAPQDRQIDRLLVHSSLTPSLTVNYLWEWFSVRKQVLQMAKWEGSVALVHTHYDPALWT